MILNAPPLPFAPIPGTTQTVWKAESTTHPFPELSNLELFDLMKNSVTSEDIDSSELLSDD